MEPSRRIAITAALRRGEALTNEEDAELLYRTDARLDYVRRASRVWELMSIPIVAAVIAYAVAEGAWVAYIVVVLGFAWWLVASATSAHQSRRRKRSVAATRALYDA